MLFLGSLREVCCKDIKFIIVDLFMFIRMFVSWGPDEILPSTSNKSKIDSDQFDDIEIVEERIPSNLKCKIDFFGGGGGREYQPSVSGNREQNLFESFNDF